MAMIERGYEIGRGRFIGMQMARVPDVGMMMLVQTMLVSVVMMHRGMRVALKPLVVLFRNGMCVPQCGRCSALDGDTQHER